MWAVALHLNKNRWSSCKRGAYDRIGNDGRGEEDEEEMCRMFTIQSLEYDRMKLKQINKYIKRITNKSTEKSYHYILKAYRRV